MIKKRYDSVRCLSLPVCILLLSLLSGKPGFADEKLEMKKEMRLSTRVITVKVLYDRGHEDWAERSLKETEAYLKAIERYLNQTYGSRREAGFSIAGAREVRIEDRWVGGYNDMETVHLEYRLTPKGNPALLFHEIGHFWFVGAPEEIQWMAEGIVSFLPVALVDEGYLSDEVCTVKRIYQHWGLNMQLPSDDPPLIKDFRDQGDKFGLFYVKSFRVQYIIYKEIGKERYRRLVNKFLDHDSCMDNEEMLEMLNGYKPMDWKSILTGWVFPGAYTEYPPAWFRNL